MRLHIRLTPKAACNAIDGWGEDAQGRRVLKVRVRAAPIEGRANEAMIALMAEALDLPKSRLSLVSGDTSRLKTVEITGTNEADILNTLP